TEYREPRRPGTNGLQSALRHARLVAIHPEDERGDGVKVVASEALQDGLVLFRLIESFADALEVLRVDGLEAHEDPLAAALGDQGNQFLVAQQVHADLRYPGHLGAARDNLTQQGLGAAG